MSSFIFVDEIVRCPHHLRDQGALIKFSRHLYLPVIDSGQPEDSILEAVRLLQELEEQSDS